MTTEAEAAGALPESYDAQSRWIGTLGYRKQGE